MSEWYDWPSWRRLTAIARAPDASAAAIGSLAAGSLVELVEGLADYHPDALPDAVLEIAGELLERHGGMAPIISLVNTVFLAAEEGVDRLVEELRAVQRRSARAAGLLGRIGAGMLEPGSSVLTVGGSTSVRAMLVEAGTSRRVFVSCVATMPEGEGIELASDLAAAGLPVEVVPDEEALDAVEGVDVVLCGATAVGPEGFSNAPGTYGVLRVAREVGIPRFLVVSIEKALPAPLFERALAVSGHEEIPLAFAGSVITELGLLDPRALGKLAADRAVAERLLA